MAVGPNALTTLAKVKDELQITGTAEDSYLECLIDQLSGAVEDFLDRSLGFVTGEVEAVKGYGNRTIRVSRTPVATITDVTFLGTTLPLFTVDPTEVIIHNANAGLLFRRGGWPWTTITDGRIAMDPWAGEEERSIQVTYDGGYVLPNDPSPTLPFGLERAVTLAVASSRNQRGRDRSISEEHIMSWGTKYSGASKNSLGAELGSPFGDEVTALLLPYRRVPGC